MANTIKEGLDYFPLDNHLEDNIRLIEAKYGLEGFAILIKLFQKIYSRGYYIKWEQENALLFSNDINVDINHLNNIINDCFVWNVFNKNLHKEHRILTSHGIQKRYVRAAKRRKIVKIINQFDLLSEEERYDNIINVDINSINGDINSINGDSNKQSKVKERKGSKGRKESNGQNSKNLPNHSFLPNNKFKNLPKKYQKIANRINEDQFELSKDFIEYQKNQFPELIKNDSFKDILKGADTIRLLQEQDEFEFDSIKNALFWGIRDDFWADKILSLATIRKKSKSNGSKKFINMYRNYKNSKGYKNKSQYERLKNELE